MNKSSLNREQVAKALGPIWDWYQSDEEQDRPLDDILRDISADVQKDRHYVLSFRGRLSTIMKHIQDGTVEMGQLEAFCRDMWEIRK
jgi:hypothetical protein